MKIIRSLAVAGLFILSHAQATVVSERFVNDPALQGWRVFGDTNLFHWNPADNQLAVTWDSSRPNSYYYHALGTALSSSNDFMLAFDLRLNDIATGTDPGYPSTFQLAIGLINFSEATNDAFIIGTGYQAPDLVEFDYFPAFADAQHSYSASVTTPIISSGNNFANVGFTVPLELTPGTLYHAVMVYTAENQTLHTTLSSNGVPAGPVQDTTLYAGFGDFSVDTLSINNYSDAGQDLTAYTNSDGSTVVYAGSLLAHGEVHSLLFASPLPVTRIVAGAPGSVGFNGTTNWFYTLERSTNFQSWTDASLPVAGRAGPMTLTDMNPPTASACYRVRASLP